MVESPASSWRSGGASWSEEEVGCRDTRQKATGNLSRSGSNKLVIAFSSALCGPSRCGPWGGSALRALPSDEECNGLIRHVLNLKVTPCASFSGCDKALVAFCLRVTTGSSLPSNFGVVGCGLLIYFGVSLLMLNVTGRYITFISEGGTLVVATWWRQVGCCFLDQKATFLWSSSDCLWFWLWFCIRLADGPSGVVPGRGAVCASLEGLSTRKVVTITWDPQPHASIRGSSPGDGRAQVSDLEQKGKTVGTAPDCCFSNPFLGAVHGGTRVCSSLTSWRVRGARGFYLWTLDLVETWLFLPDLEEVWDVGCLCRETLVSRSRSGVPVVLLPLLLEFLLLWLVRDWLSLLSLVNEAHPPTLFR
ncbi:hypothetical protein Taro_005799 [Colocasia esculenta]|uniref:Uncharacterized protein n=1 Tax=Colocasia esculenta TaxID=4460 RepID=A0A843TYX4_COLES|nr:hypothetical protein [Colocasia esculenta]